MIFKLIISVLLLAGAVEAASVKLAWDAIPGASGYRLYVGTSSRTYTVVTPFANAGTNVLSGLQVGVTYYFAATQIVNVGTNVVESDYSNEIVTVPRPEPPVIFLIITNTIQSSESLQGPWRDETNLLATIATSTNRFMRVKAGIAKQ